VPNNEAIVYGRSDCTDTAQARETLESRDVPYRWVDLDVHPELRAEAVAVNGGSTKVPTVVLPGGTVFVEPTAEQIIEALSQA